jgi:transketolase
MGWDRYADSTLGIDRFGASAPGSIALEKLGINLNSVISAATDLIKSFNS